MIPLTITSPINPDPRIERINLKLTGYCKSTVLLDKLLTFTEQPYNLSIDDIEKVVDMIISTCNYCWNKDLEEGDCYCVCDD